MIPRLGSSHLSYRLLRATFVVVPLGEGALGRLLDLLELVKRVAVGSKSQLKF